MIRRLVDLRLGCLTLFAVTACETMSSEKEGQEEEGNVSARAVASVAIIDTGLQRLYANLRKV